MKETKHEIRKRIYEVRNAMTSESCREKSSQICDNIIRSSYYQNADTVYLYMAFRNEADLFGVIQSAFDDGKTVAIPKIAKDNSMKFYRLQKAADKSLLTEPGYFGIDEPVVTSNEQYAIEKPDLLLMPGIAFDKNGNRIGYGKGYYDTYLESLGGYADKVMKVGVAYTCQLTENIPTIEHDYRVDAIVTEAEFRVIGGSYA